jgi:SP family sugar:H+ symporter-like MFS transporter
VISGKQEEARKLFARIGGSGKELVAQVEKSIAGAHRPRLSDLIVPGMRRIVPVVWVGVGPAALQQLIGINIIFYFGEVLWKAAGATERLALNINLLTAVINILATVPAIMLIDRVGRKPLLLIGSIGMALALGVVAFVFATAGVGPDGKPLLGRESAITGLVAANLFIAAFAVSWGPVMWVLLGEMFPNRLRAAGLAVSGATNWIANFAVTVTFLPLMKHVGLSWTYGLYTLAAVASVIFVLTAVRETKGKALEEM